MTITTAPQHVADADVENIRNRIGEMIAPRVVMIENVEGDSDVQPRGLHAWKVPHLSGGNPFFPVDDLRDAEFIPMKLRGRTRGLDWEATLATYCNGVAHYEVSDDPE